MTLTTPPLTESQFQTQILELAHILHWESFHVRAGRTKDSWRTPGSGTMARGWPDLVLVHPIQRRVIFAEVKTDAGKLTADQQRVLSVFDVLLGLVEVYVWRPRGWDSIEETLRRRSA